MSNTCSGLFEVARIIAILGWFALRPRHWTFPHVMCDTGFPDVYGKESTAGALMIPNILVPYSQH